MKKVLIVTYHFAPFQTSGVYRPLKMAKYLRDFGWEPVILTVANPSKKRRDDSLEKDLPPGLLVRRALSLETDRFLDRTATAWHRLSGHNGGRNNGRPKLLAGIGKVLRRYLLIPDDKIGWLPHAMIKAARLVDTFHIDCICTTSPPHSSHFIGYALKQQKNLPWVADFRDPWSDAFMKRDVLFRLELRRKLESRMEYGILNAADVVTTTSEGIRDLLVKKGGRTGRRVEVITNGFDESDFDFTPLDQTLLPGEDAFTITHIGRVYPGKLDPFLNALRELTAENPSLAEKIRVRLVGYYAGDLVRRIRQLGLDGRVDLLGFKSHQEAIAHMFASDVLLLNVGGERFWIPGKLFEYLRAGRPILVIGEKGDAADIALKSGLGILASHERVGEIKAAILDLYRRRRPDRAPTQPGPAYVERFDRKFLTGEFARVLDQAVLSRTSPGLSDSDGRSPA